MATILEACDGQPLLLILDDLHWADVSSLRVLRLLIESDRPHSLVVLSTWRSQPPPTGALADVAEMLARAHALRIELTGLSADQAADVVERLVVSTNRCRSRRSAAADRWQSLLPGRVRAAGRRAGRSGWAAGRGQSADRGERGADPATRPAADRTRTVLRLASVIGRQFDLAVLAAASGLDEDSVLDALEPAQQAGLVREDGVDRFSFAHALVRDTAYTEVSASRRARLHAQVAQAVSGRPGRRASWRCTGSLPDRGTRTAPGALRSSPPSRPVRCMRTSAPSSFWRRRWPRWTTTPARGRESATTC